MNFKNLKIGRRFDRSTLVAICSGVLCALCVVAYMLQIKDQASASQREILEKYGGEQIEVCVATRDIAGGESVRDSDLETRMWIAGLLPDGAITKRSDIVGKQLGSSVLKGEVFSSTRLQSASSVLDVPDGLVAVSVPLDETSAVGGSLSPNQCVDIYATGSTTTTKIGENVQILETSNSGKSNSTDTKWITLAVEQDKVAELVSAAQKLELYVALPSTKNTTSKDSVVKETKR